MQEFFALIASTSATVRSNDESNGRRTRHHRSTPRQQWITCLSTTPELLPSVSISVVWLLRHASFQPAKCRFPARQTPHTRNWTPNNTHRRLWLPTTLSTVGSVHRLIAARTQISWSQPTTHHKPAPGSITHPNCQWCLTTTSWQSPWNPTRSQPETTSICHCPYAKLWVFFCDDGIDSKWRWVMKKYVYTLQD